MLHRLIVALGALSLAVPATASAGDPFTCSGYPQPRVFLESQSGWSDAEDTTYGEAEHVHAGACFPVGQTLTGTVQLDVVSKMHNAQGHYLRKVRVQAASSQGVGAGMPEKDWGSMRLCLSHDCTFVTSLSFDTAQLEAGKWEFRVHSDVRRFLWPVTEPSNLATGGWLACVRDCSGPRTPQAVAWPGTEARGWYRSDEVTKGYITARMMEALPKRVSGTWTPLVRIVNGSNEGINPVDRSFASVDPNFHATPADPGRVLVDAPGEHRNERLSIDTTLLSEGPHKLMLRAYGTTGYDGQQWGALVMPFVVDNTAAKTTP